MSVLGFFDFLLEMKDCTFSVFAEEGLALVNRRRARWAAGIFSVFSAAEHAFHSHPLRNYYFSGISPFEVLKLVLAEQFFQLLSIAHVDRST
jgi:hypothetical protein